MEKGFCVVRATCSPYAWETSGAHHPAAMKFPRTYLDLAYFKSDLWIKLALVSTFHCPTYLRAVWEN